MSVFFHDTVAILRPAEKTNRAGEKVLDYSSLSAADGIPWPRVQVRPLSQAEVVAEDREAALSQWRIANEAGDVDLLDTDWVRIPDGTVCKVVGDPARPTDPFSRAVHHVEVTVERVSG